MDILITILSIVAFSIVVLVLYNVLKSYVLYKIKANKWVVLVSAMLLLVVPMLIWTSMPRFIANYIIPGMVVILILWFMDLAGFMKNRNSSKTNSTTISAKKDKKNDVVIRPKAKPNRVKNNQKKL